MTQRMNQPEEKLSAALRELAACSRQSASPEMAGTLKNAFRRHHRRRRLVFRVRIALVCLCVAGLATLFLLKKSSLSSNSAQTVVVHTIPPQEVTSPVEVNIATARPSAVPKHRERRRNTSVDAKGFWALPSYALIPSDDQLRVVRMEMRGEDLRLVGAPVPLENIRRRVTADFVVGQDGTPYAVRLVQASY